MAIRLEHRGAHLEPKPVYSHTRANPLLSLSLVLFVAACGRGGQGAATQVVATVNDDEITVHQVNQAIQRLGNISEVQARDAQKRILDRLVDQQLFLQQARDRKMDRDPAVVAAVDAAKRQIIAQAYAEQIMSAAPKATPTQIKAFYLEHPELFQKRRIYGFAQLAVVVTEDKQQAIRAKLEELEKGADKQKILIQFAEWLKGQDLQFRTTQTTQAAEQLPLESLGRYQQLKVGDLTLTPGRQGLVVSQLIATQTQPLSQEQAQPFIEQYLQNRERQKLSEDEMRRLHSVAKIRFLGEFAKLEQVPSSADKSARKAAPAVASETATGVRSQSKVDQDALANGVKALK
jgi:EpsD family peptidyl-prolyl cis-trans isomerase